MTSDKADDASRDALNRGLDKEEDRLRDAEKRSQHTEPSEATDPERSTTPPKNAERDLAHLENPPQTEGPRERSNDGV
jgi:hypothetical protein